MRRWEPILSRSSDAGQRAWELVLAVADRPTQQRPSAEDALLCAYLSLAGEDASTSRAIERLNAAIGEADALCSTGRFGLLGGLAGLGWVVEDVAGIVSPNEDADLNGDTDEALVRELERGRWRGTCDLESGLAGIGLYFIERLPASRAADGLELVIAHLESLSRPAGPGALWPAGFELDVARGIPGLIHFLLAAESVGIQEASVRPLLDESIAWLHHQSEAAALPSLSSSLGTAAVCFPVARAQGRSDCLELAQWHLNHCLDVTPADAAAGGVFLRRGAAGIAHAFNRIYQTEEDVRCRELALIWFARTLDSQALIDYENRSLLDGVTGVALALLSALTPLEPMWDRRLLPSTFRHRVGA